MAVFWKVMLDLRAGSTSDKDRMRMDVVLLRVTSLVLWMSTIVHYTKKEHLSCLWASLTWVSVFTIFDIYLMYSVDESHESMLPEMKLEPSMVLATSFGLCSMVGMQKDSEYQSFVLYAILGCMMGVVPSMHNVDPETLLYKRVREVQKTTLGLCIGTLVSGVLLTRFCNRSK